MNILKVEFYPPIKRQPYLRKHFVKILNYRNKNTEIQCKFKTRRFIKTDKMKFYITNGTQGKQMPYVLVQPFTEDKQENHLLSSRMFGLFGGLVAVWLSFMFKTNIFYNC